MNFLKKYWYLLFISLITGGLGIVTYLTSQKLNQEKPVAPNVAQITPHAAAAACQVAFAIPTPPGDTPTNTPPDTSTNTPTNTLAHTPTNTPPNTPTSTPVPLCNSTCDVDSDCPSGLVCAQDGSNKFCRNSQCTSESDCDCPKPTNTPTNTPTPVPLCNDTCSSNSDCPSGLVCYTSGSNSYCRNSSCTSETDCQCPGITNTPSPIPTPSIPVAGTGPSVLGAATIGGAILLLLLGLAL